MGKISIPPSIYSPSPLFSTLLFFLQFTYMHTNNFYLNVPPFNFIFFIHVLLTKIFAYSFLFCIFLLNLLTEKTCDLLSKAFFSKSFKENVNFTSIITFNVSEMTTPRSMKYVFVFYFIKNNYRLFLKHM